MGELAYDDCGGPGSAHRWAARHRLGRAAGGWMPPGPSRVRPPRPTRAPHPPWPSPGSPRSWTTGHGPPAARTADGRDELGRLGCLAKQRRLRPMAARSFLIAGRNRRSSPEQCPGFLAAAPRERWRLPGGPGRRSESASAPRGRSDLTTRQAPWSVPCRRVTADAEVGRAPMPPEQGFAGVANGYLCGAAAGGARQHRPPGAGGASHRQGRTAGMATTRSPGGWSCRKGPSATTSRPSCSSSRSPTAPQPSPRPATPVSAAPDRCRRTYTDDGERTVER